MADILKMNQYDYKNCPLREIADLRDSHLEEKINELDKKNQKEHEKFKTQIDKVKEELTNKIENIRGEIENKIDETSFSIKEAIEKTLQEKAGKSAVRILKWVSGITSTTIIFIFRNKIIEIIKGLFNKN